MHFPQFWRLQILGRIANIQLPWVAFGISLNSLSILTSLSNGYLTILVLSQTGLLTVLQFKNLSYTFLFIINFVFKSVLCSSILLARLFQYFLKALGSLLTCSIFHRMPGHNAFSQEPYCWSFLCRPGASFSCISQILLRWPTPPTCPPILYAKQTKNYIGCRGRGGSSRTRKSHWTSAWAAGRGCRATVGSWHSSRFRCSCHADHKTLSRFACLLSLLLARPSLLLLHDSNMC